MSSGKLQGRGDLHLRGSPGCDFGGALGLVLGRHVQLPVPPGGVLRGRGLERGPQRELRERYCLSECGGPADVLQTEGHDREEDVQYAPVVFFAAHTVLSSELQLTARVVANSVILAVVLLRDAKLFGSYVFASFEGSGTYKGTVK